jgi:hypothetical protein
MRSLVAVGRESAFPIDYSTGKHWELMFSLSTVIAYSKELAMHLTPCHTIAEHLVREQRSYYREFINATKPDSRVYRVGDIVFVRRTVQSISR